MGWVKLDDGFFLNPKVMAAGPQAATFYLAALCWSGSANTDGFIPDYALPAISAQVSCRSRAEIAQRLRSAELWREAPGGHVIHDFLQWQASADDRSHQRKRNRAKAERHRERAVSNPVTNPVGNPVGDRSVTEPEGRDQRKEKRDARSEGARTAFEADFDAWYRAYPRKRERKAALTRYITVRRSGVPAADLLTAAERYAEHGRRTGRPAEMTKHPATFLHNGWDDWVPGGAVDQEHRVTNGQRPAWEVPEIAP